MMSPKLRALQRQLSEQGPRGGQEAQNSDARIFAAIHDAIQGEANQLIAAAQEAQHEAEEAADELREQNAQLQAELLRVQQEYRDHLAAMKEESAAEYSQSCQQHDSAMSDMHNRMHAMMEELNNERVLRAQAEAQVNAAGAMHNQLAGIMAKLQPVQETKAAPIIAPAPAKPFPFKLDVIRDVNGRIAGAIATPTT